MNLSNGHRKFLRKFVLLDDYTFLGYYFYSLLKKKGKKIKSSDVCIGISYRHIGIHYLPKINCYIQINMKKRVKASLI